MITLSKRIATYINFNKGRNDSVSSDTLLQEELKEAINVELSRRGGYNKRLGCTKAISSALGAGEVKRLMKYGSLNLATVGNSLVKWDGTVISSALSSGYVGSQFFTNTKLYLLDGTKYWVYDGTTLSEVTAAVGSDLTAVKRCKFLLQRGQRMFAIGDPQNPNFIYFSEPGEPNNFKAANIVKAISDDDDGLSSLFLFHESVIAFKRRKVYAWTGWDPNTDVRFDELDADWGTVSPQSIVKAENFLLYLGDDAVMALYGNDAGNLSSMRVSPGITELLKTVTHKDKAVGIYHKGKYYLAVCTDGSGQNNTVLVGYVNMYYQAMDDQSGSTVIIPFTVNDGWKVSQWYIDNNDDLFFGSYDGFVYRAFDGYNDNGVAIKSKVIHRLNLGDSFRIKKLKSVLLLARQYDTEKTHLKVTLTMSNKTITMDVRINDGGVWDESDWDDALWDFADVIVKDLPVGNKCSRLEVTIEHEILNELMTVYGFAAVFKPKKAKGVKIGVTNKQTL